MKLIDILARDLDEWPFGAVYSAQDGNAYAWAYNRMPDFNSDLGFWEKPNCTVFSVIGMMPELATDHATAIITREQWEEARRGLSGSVKDAVNELKEYEKSQWRGPQDGLPPVGMHCEITYGVRAVWQECVRLPDGNYYIKISGDWRVLDSDYVYDPAYRALKTDRDRWIEQVDELTENMPPHEWPEAIYDAGLGRLKEEE